MRQRVWVAAVVTCCVMFAILTTIAAIAAAR